MIFSNQIKLAKGLMKTDKNFSLLKKYSSTFESKNLLDLRKRGLLVGIFPDRL